MRYALTLLVLTGLISACSEPVPAPAPEPHITQGGKKIVKSDEEWRRELTDLQYRVTREKETERPGTGEYLHTKTHGTYVCVCCGAELFSSDTKYDSGCGWPSFYEAILNGNVEYTEDRSHGMVRTEITCARCGAHLGHVFDDGPLPTGKRFCVNSASLRLVEKPGKE